MSEENKLQYDRLQWIIRWLDWDRLSDWEMMFITSLEKQLDDKSYTLSEKQEEIMERIHKEKTQD